MSTLLENYQTYIEDMPEMNAQSSLSTEKVWQYQELLYRIEVLKTCQIYSKYAPKTEDLKKLYPHYQIFDAFIQCLITERRCGLPPDEKVQKQRETAHQNLCLVVADYRKRFANFAPKAADSFTTELTRAVNTFLPAWIQYRNTYVNIKKEDPVNDQQSGTKQ